MVSRINAIRMKNIEKHRALKYSFFRESKTGLWLTTNCHIEWFILHTSVKSWSSRSDFRAKTVIGQPFILNLSRADLQKMIHFGHEQGLRLLDLAGLLQSSWRESARMLKQSQHYVMKSVTWDFFIFGRPLPKVTTAFSKISATWC